MATKQPPRISLQSPRAFFVREEIVPHASSSVHVIIADIIIFITNVALTFRILNSVRISSPKHDSFLFYYSSSYLLNSSLLWILGLGFPVRNRRRRRRTFQRWWGWGWTVWMKTCRSCWTLILIRRLPGALFDERSGKSSSPSTIACSR